MINKKVAEHFTVDINDEGLSWQRDEQKIADEAALDGIYVIRTSLPAGVLSTGGAVESSKALENVERVFRGLNTDLLIRPIRHRFAELPHPCARYPSRLPILSGSRSWMSADGTDQRHPAVSGNAAPGRCASPTRSSGHKSRRIVRLCSSTADETDDPDQRADAEQMSLLMVAHVANWL